jgi:hypothetical protein
VVKLRPNSAEKATQRRSPYSIHLIPADRENILIPESTRHVHVLEESTFDREDSERLTALKESVIYFAGLNVNFSEFPAMEQIINEQYECLDANAALSQI